MKQVFFESPIRFSRHCKYSARLYKYFQFSQHFSPNIFQSSDPVLSPERRLILFIDILIWVGKHFCQEGTSFIFLGSYLQNLEFILRGEYINFVRHSPRLPGSVSRDIGSDLNIWCHSPKAPLSCSHLPFRLLSSSPSIYLETSLHISRIMIARCNCVVLLSLKIIRYFQLALNVLSPILFDISGFGGEISSSGHILFNQIWLVFAWCGIVQRINTRCIITLKLWVYIQHYSNIHTSLTRPCPARSPVSCSVWPWVALCLQMLGLASRAGCRAGDPGGFLWPELIWGLGKPCNSASAG